MTSGFDGPAQPPARRDNGLRADQFVALADVDPRLGEHLLDLLRLAEIAAYLEPSTDPRIAVRYRVSGPVERLYVHADQRQQARAVVVAAAHEAGESAPDVVEAAVPSGLDASTSRPDVLAGIDTDAEFARIVSGFVGARPSPAATDRAAPTNRPAIDLVRDDADDVLAADDDRAVYAPDEVATNDATTTVTPAQLDAAADAAARARDRAASVAEQAEDDDEHFHPPPAPPFPVPTANTVSAVLLLVLGVLVLLRGDLFGLDSTMSFPASVVLMLVASALIIRGLRDQPDPEDEPEDDGAEV